MSVDLADYVASLQRECSAPGVNDFPNATDSDWIGQLSDGFWEARLDGLLSTYTCDENGLVTQVVPTVPVIEMGRDWVQLVVLYASFRVVRNTLRGLQTQFKAQAGPVSFEYQQSANMLVAIMKDITERRNVILLRLSDVGSTQSYLIDSIMARDASLMYGYSTWIGYGNNYQPNLYGQRAY